MKMIVIIIYNYDDNLFPNICLCNFPRGCISSNTSTEYTKFNMLAGSTLKVRAGKYRSFNAFSNSVNSQSVWLLFTNKSFITCNCSVGLERGQCLVVQ